MTKTQGLFRLVGRDGRPHPVLDTPYETIDSAVSAAKDWCLHNANALSTDDTIGIEVKTHNGSWRTIRYS